jgi:ribonuclease HI
VVAGQAVPEKTTAEKAADKTAKAVAAVPKPSARAWVAYTDGACSGNPGPAGSGFVVIAPDGKIAEGYEHLGTSTNNVAELTGILRALEAVPKGVPELVIHTDSKYAIGVLSKGWKAKVNQELIAATKRAVAARTGAGERVTFVYVPAHAGVPINERADELAREAIRTGGSKPAVVATTP